MARGNKAGGKRQSACCAPSLSRLKLLLLYCVGSSFLLPAASGFLQLQSIIHQHSRCMQPFDASVHNEHYIQRKIGLEPSALKNFGLTETSQSLAYGCSRLKTVSRNLFYQQRFNQLPSLSRRHFQRIMGARHALIFLPSLFILPQPAAATSSLVPVLGAVDGAFLTIAGRQLSSLTSAVIAALSATSSKVIAMPIRGLFPSRRSIIRATVVLFLCWFVCWSTLDWIRVRRRQKLDATSEWCRYADYPSARGRALMALMGKLVPMYVASRVVNRNALLVRSGRLLADGLLKLGPLYIKLGQIVSCREKLFPEEWKEAMERLQDQVPARQGQDALYLAYGAWPKGKDDFHRVFSEFDTTPLAAASLGQVHKATLASTGETVAIKLQRPYLREIYDQDLNLLNKIAAAVDRFAGSKGQVGGVSQSWVEIFKDAEGILYREIDYRDESENIMRFCGDFGLDKGGQPAEKACAVSRDGKPLPSAAPWLRTPIVHDDLSTEKVLVMEYVPSIKITNKTGLNAANVTADDKEYLAEILARSYLRQFCSNLFFSTDPHPGNLGVEILNADAKLPQDRVRLVFYDFGQAATLNQNQADGILSIVEAIVDSDVERSMEAFQQMGVLKGDADLDKVRAKVADNYKTGKVKANRKRLRKKGYKFKDSAKSSNSTTTLTNTTSGSDAEVVQYFTLPAEYAFVGRALSQMDGVGKSLDAEFDFVSSAAPYIVEIKGAGKYLQEEATKIWKKFVKEIQRFASFRIPRFVDKPRKKEDDV